MFILELISFLSSLGKKWKKIFSAIDTPLDPYQELFFVQKRKDDNSCLIFDFIIISLVLAKYLLDRF